jgi:protease-4
MKRRGVVGSRGAAALCAAAALCVCAQGQAQQQSLTEGVAAPLPALVERTDALSLELNPAGLSHLRGVDLVLLHNETSDNLREGSALFVGGELFDGVGVGYGLQLISPGLLEEGYRKHTLGLGVGGDVSVGVAWHLLGSSDSEAVDDLSAWDLGVQYRATSWLGFGAAARDLNAPFLGGVAVRPQVSVGAALRPWEGRLLVELQQQVRAGSERSQPRALVAVEPLEGVRVFGQVELDTDRNLGDLQQTRALVGLELNTERLGVTSGAGFGDRSGFAVALRATGARQRSLWPTQRSFYQVTLRGELSERQPRDLLGRPSGASFLSLVRALDQMRDDPAVQGVVVEIDELSMGYGQLWELRTRLLALRDAGKEVVAYLHSTNQRDYYVATAASQVWMGPSATFNARGLSLTQSFFRGALDKLGVEPQFIRIAEYKSAPESYTREAPSEASEEAINAFLDAVWQHMLTAMAEGRGLGAGEMDGLIQTAPHTPDQALQGRLVDRVIYADEVEEALRERYPGATLSKRWRSPSEGVDSWGKAPIVAVLHIDGSIVTGSGGVNPLLGEVSTGDEAVEQVAEWARTNPNVKALVVRIDSPGGSAIASDRIFRHLRRVAEKKPLIVSMGDIAASGGYYAAAAGQEIFCSPTTLTGSIGIFSGKFALNALFARVGYNPITQKRGERADLYTLDRPWSEEEQRVILDQITYLYELFLSQVSLGRDRPREELHKVARGRIWAGSDAREVGLCDRHGGLNEALREAAARAGLRLEDAQIVAAPTSAGISPLAGLGLSLHGGQVPLEAVEGWLGPRDPEASDLQRYEAMAPLRALLAPWRAALTLGLLYEDGEPLALLPFLLEE